MPNSAGVEVARISAKVSPDTKKFRRELLNDLEAIERSVSAKIDVEPDMSGFRQKVASFTRGLEAKVKLDVDRSQLDQLGNATKGGIGMPGGGGGGVAFGIAALVAGLALAAPLAGVVATTLAALPGVLAAVATPIGALALGIDGLKVAASSLAAPFEILKGTMSAAVARQFTPVFEQLGTIFPMLGKALPAVTQGVADMFAGFTNVITSSGGMARIEGIIGNIGTALSAASPGVQMFTNGMLGLAEEFSAKLPGIATWFNELGTSFSGWVDKMSANGGISAAFDGLGTVVDQIVTSLAPILNQGIEFMGDPEKVEALRASIEVLGSVISGAVTASAAFFQVLYDMGAGLDRVIAAASLIPVAFSAAWSGLSSAASVAWTSVTTIVQNAIATISGVVSNIGSTISGLWDGISSAAAGAWNSITSAAASAFNSLVSAASSAVSGVVSAVATIPGQVAAALSGLAAAGASAGAALVQGLVNGIGGMIGSAVAKARELASSVANAVTGFLGINSPSKLFTDYGQWTAEGFADGLVSGFEPVINQAKSVAESISKAFDDGLSISPVDATALDRSIDALELEQKRLRVEFNGIPKEDKESRAALQSQMDQVRAQKDILSYQQKRLDLEEEIGSVSNPMVEAAAGLMNAPVDFAKATGKQFMSDLGIGGDGLISKAITEGISYIFQIGSVDEAMSIKDREESKSAMAITGRK